MLPIRFLPSVSDKIKDKELADKLKADKKKTRLSKSNVVDMIELIRQDVEKSLGKYADQYRCITTVEELQEYINKANEHGYIAIDTETTGLNPMVDKIVGLCLYFPGEKGVYVPINHLDYFTGIRLDNQLSEEDIKPILEQLTARIIMHNAQFDIRVIKHTIKVKLKCWWDTQIASTLLDENESHRLKDLHSKYVSGEEEKSFSDLFGNTTFTDIPIEYAYLYAVHDAVDTFDLFMYQRPLLNNKREQEDDRDMYWLFTNVEMPMVDVIVALEDVGVSVDVEYLDTLKEKYHNNLKVALDKCYSELELYKDKIDKYNATHYEKPLKTPLNIGSPSQLAILFYDILKAKELKGKGARSTDVDMMNYWKEKYPIAKAILEYRAAQKIASTYIDNIYDIIHTDGRVHTHFHSNGAKTGRMSSSDPLNLQNIPSHNEDIRKMFVGQTTYRDVDKRDDGAYIFDRQEEIELSDGTWQWVELIKVGDKLSSGEIVKAVKIKDFKVLLGV